MSRRSEAKLSAWVTGGQAAFLAVFLLLVGCSSDAPEETVPESTDTEIVAPEEIEEGDLTFEVELYFPGSVGWLLAERREVPIGEDSEDAGATEAMAARISAVVTSLLAGPRTVGMEAPLPEGVSVRKVYLSDDGLAFLDLEFADGRPPASGSQREMLTVYSLVNTVLLNFEELDRVVLLWNGQQLRTFAGHVNTMRPLVANVGLIARDTEASLGGAGTSNGGQDSSASTTNAEHASAAAGAEHASVAARVT